MQPCAIGLPEPMEARPRLLVLRRGLRWRSAVVRLRRAAMNAASVLSSDNSLGQVGH